MCVALVAVVASVSGLNVAQQDLAVELGASQSTLLWIINGYTLALAALLLPFGAIGDRWGRKTVLVTGLGLFAATNVVAALSTTATMLLVARVGAGVGAAMIMPVTLSVITSTFPPDERAKAVGTWAGFAGAGGILGLFASSFVIDYLSWPWVFAVPVALAVGALVMTVRVVAQSREAHAGRFDVVGSLLSMAAIGGLVLAIHEGPTVGWTATITLVGLVVGGAAFPAFVLWELRQANPLLDVRVFANRSLAAGSVALASLFAVMFGLFLVLVQYLQAVLGFSALVAAAGLLPMALVMMPLSAAAGVFVRRYGTRTVMLVGFGAFVTGLVLLATMASVDGGYLSVLPGLVVLGAGVGLAMTPSTTAITESMPVDKQGVASALNDTVREVGGAVGVALLGSILNAGYRANVADVADQLPPEAAQPVEEGIGGALAGAERLGGPGGEGARAARRAFVDGWQSSMWLGVGIAVATLAFIYLRAPRRSEATDVLDGLDDPVMEPTGA